MWFQFFKYIFKRNYSLLNVDAWSDGQVASKLWLCEEMEKIAAEGAVSTRVIWIYGSWYGTLAYLLLSRGRLKIDKIVCFDIDGDANKIARKILNHWEIHGPQIEIYQEDCALINANSPHFVRSKPDLIINTSCEHMENYQWFQNIPSDTALVLQSTDMIHPTHINTVDGLNELEQKASPASYLYRGEKEFNYPSLKFKRFMLIGKKN